MTGIVSRHDKNWILVSTSGKHMLIVEKVINSKGKNIINQIKGDRFITHPKYIFNSLKKELLWSKRFKKLIFLKIKSKILYSEKLIVLCL